jgi:hypothetical protein
MTTITLVLVSHSWKGKTTLKVKGRYPSRGAAKQAERKLRTRTVGGYSNDRTDYRVLGPRQLAALVAQISKEHAARRKIGATKAAATRKQNGKKPTFILCPTCGAKSKKLFSEFGGLQTRRCRNGHNFEVDTFFGFETHKRRVERTDRPLYVPGSYTDYVYGKFK